MSVDSSAGARPEREHATPSPQEKSRRRTLEGTERTPHRQPHLDGAANSECLPADQPVRDSRWLAVAPRGAEVIDEQLGDFDFRFELEGLGCSLELASPDVAFPFHEPPETRFLCVEYPRDDGDAFEKCKILLRRRGSAARSETSACATAQ